MISVCITNHNGDEFILEQLLSILSQLSEIDEVIISDDDSTDQTVEIKRNLRDKRIIIYSNENKKGLYQILKMH